MQIVDRFDNDIVKFSFPLQRKGMIWGHMDNDKYVYMFLRCLENDANDKLKYRRVYTVYDLCMDLKLCPKLIYAYAGWKDNDVVAFNHYIDDSRIIIGFECKLL